MVDLNHLEGLLKQKLLVLSLRDYDSVGLVCLQVDAGVLLRDADDHTLRTTALSS